jgi:RNA polymerase sigma-70 factor, ECF subfamily
MTNTKTRSDVVSNTSGGRLADDTQQRSKEFEASVQEHLNMLYAVALRLTRNDADAEDLVQNTVVKALRFHRKFQKGTYIKAWLLTILRNTFINDYRRTARRPIHVELSGTEPAAPAYSPDPMTRNNQSESTSSQLMELLDEEVRQAIDALPNDFRSAVVMADLQGSSYKEIASTMGCPLGTVMSRIHRGRKLLRNQLHEYARSRRLEGCSA